MGWRECVVVLTIVSLSCGCPAVTVRKNPGDHDKGIRYYRPKPYLLVTPAGATINELDKEGKKVVKSTHTPSDQAVNIALEYLPDFSEEYSIRVKSGFGIANVSLKLEEGWNLTEINQDLDSQTDENITALADLAESVGGIAKGFAVSANEAGGTPPTHRFVVCATNVPIGYYESVIGYDHQCKKRLAGWKYVGFAPYNACPTDIVGSCSVACNDPQAAVYGLVFEEGVMVFRELGTITLPNTQRTAVPMSE